MEEKYMESIKINNICGKFNLNCNLKLDSIMNKNYEKLNNKKYNKKTFSALIAKYNNTKLTVLLFSNGRIILTGAKFEAEMEKCLLYLIEVFAIGDKNVTDLKITNICASTSLKKPINLRKMAEENGEICSYEPELFPGLFAKISNHKFIIHHSGKIFTTGIKDKNIINQLFKDLYKIIYPYIKNI